MAHDIHNLTVQEAQNFQLGQGKSAHLDSTEAFFDIPNNEVVIAIQVIQDCTFAALEAEDPYRCFDTTSTNDNTHDSGTDGSYLTGDKVGTSTTFVAGLVLYGRWTKVDLSTGVVNLYLGK